MYKLFNLNPLLRLGLVLNYTFTSYLHHLYPFSSFLCCNKLQDVNLLKSTLKCLNFL